MKNQINQRQFRGGYVPLQHVDADNRAYKKEPASPSKSRGRMGIQLGAGSAARPGQAGYQSRIKPQSGNKGRK